MTMKQALWACKNLPEEIRGAHARLACLADDLDRASYEGAYVEAKKKMEGEGARTVRMEDRLRIAREKVLEGAIRLPATETEVVVAFYLQDKTISTIAQARRCDTRYVKRCKARAVARLLGGG